MRYIPKVVFFDYETALLDGTPSTEAYRDDFRVVSTAFAWRNEQNEITTKYCVGEAETLGMLKRCKRDNIPLVAHCLQFEWTVTKCRFPGYEDLVQFCTMRLIQMFDNGGKFQEEYTPESMSLEDHLEYLEGNYNPRSGLGLESAASRVLPKELTNHKEPFKKCILERGGKGFKDMHLLTPKESREYNTLDTIVTLHLYEELCKRFKEMGICWLQDHSLYRSTCVQVSLAKIRGVRVDKKQLSIHIEEKCRYLADVKASFREYFKKELAILELQYTEKSINSLKRPKNQELRREELKQNPIRFNTNSPKQLSDLFIGLLGMTPKHRTKPTKLMLEKDPKAIGNPTFAAKFLAQWGKGGLILKGQKRALVEYKQGESLDKISEYDGKWHVDIKAAGAATNRLAGGSHNSTKGTARLNIQGLSRGCETLMRSLIPEPGKKFISFDLSSGEPTVTSHYSRDFRYKMANFDMVGKEPYFDKDGTLMIDDMYLMTASRFPLWSEKIKEVFHTTFDGMTFGEKWLEDSDYLAKGILKPERKIAKPLCLGIGYSMGPKKMVETMYDQGYELPLKDARAFFKLYWQLFPRVKILGDILKGRLNKNEGRLVNEFGYCLKPNSPHKALNYWIQSSVTGIMHLLTAKYAELNPSAEFVSVIHDECIYSIDIVDETEAIRLWQEAVDWLNATLKWTVNMRSGAAPGMDLYEAK